MCGTHDFMNFMELMTFIGVVEFMACPQLLGLMECLERMKEENTVGAQLAKSWVFIQPTKFEFDRSS